MSDDRLTKLESRYAWLEKHCGEQDKAMFEMSEEIMRLRKEVIRLKESLDNHMQTGSGPEAPEPPPPHY
jgi:uncharacterized coiled-coil protein SlyX